MLKNIIFTVALIASVQHVTSQKINNPVLPGVADAGVIKFNGEYYVGGVFTKGSFYRSKDLVNWSGPQHVFSMNNDWATKFGIGDEQIHANDINYINGLFHMYWSVNYWGKDRNVIHIGHAVSPNITGPFAEPDKTSWLDNRIDPKLFIDDDGKLYLYMVKFTEGNTIWVRPMKDPQTFEGEPSYVFSSLPNTWETLDNRVEEGPWVMKYRNRYYLMYNTNHTATEWGNYALGVAEAASPLGFNHGNKYPYPVVQSNQWDLDEKYVDLLKFQNNGDYLYVTEKPGEKWNGKNFNAADWQSGKAGFGNLVIPNSTTRKVQTLWQSDNLWIRKTFVFNMSAAGNLALRIHHDGPTKVYINGQAIYESDSNNYAMIPLDQNTKQSLNNGENVLAISCIKGRHSAFLDVSLFDMKGDVTDDILITPGQPNIVHGPNGFDWWLVYMANKNKERRGQFINQVHFFDKTMYVDGVTSGNTIGYHAAPSMPTFGDLFDDSLSLRKKWQVESGSWQIMGGELQQLNNTSSRSFIKSTAAVNYLFEVNIKIGGGNSAKVGIYAYYKSKQDWLKISLNRQTMSCQYELMQNGKSQTRSFSLPKGFNFKAYHKISSYKNAAGFTVRIDDLPAPGSDVIKTGFAQAGLPGIFTENAKAFFDGIIYTIGWDEFDGTITGWQSTTKGKNSWSVSSQGLNQSNATGEQKVFKGDNLLAYDFNVQIKNNSDQGSAGMYAMYAGEGDYIKAGFDYQRKSLVISGMINNKAIEEKVISLETMQPVYADMTYSDFLEKHFSFKVPVYLNALKLNKNGYLKKDTLIDKIYDKVDIWYHDHDKWLPLKYKLAESDHPLFDKIVFDQIKADELKFTNKQASDHNIYIYKLWANEVFKQSYNLRVVKMGTRILFFVDGKHVYELKQTMPASGVGLYTNNSTASFNGITLHDLK
ncbi:family 43 glycosylhydrolase [Danxiaibacter flavus]|uniref:Family 43 glycosylhydrolase n=1 Tax=Danxiaibacter flavus TaxID=3049108 RepID=A0ABV3ZD26_9BACT|nr:family 43 glycosylhydrolase [Chitinophagaceae bacterium DXS]